MRHLFGDNTKQSENTTLDKMEILTKLSQLKAINLKHALEGVVTRFMKTYGSSSPPYVW